MRRGRLTCSLFILCTKTDNLVASTSSISLFLFASIFFLLYHHPVDCQLARESGKLVWSCCCTAPVRRRCCWCHTFFSFRFFTYLSLCVGFYEQNWKKRAREGQSMYAFFVSRALNIQNTERPNVWTINFCGLTSLSVCVCVRQFFFFCFLHANRV